MIRPAMVFPDPVLLTIEYLRSSLPGTLVYSRVPAGTPEDPRPPEFVRIKRLGGTSSVRSLVTDRPRLDFECWSDTEEGAEALTSDVRAYVLAMAGSRGDTTVYNVQEISGPLWLPDGDSGQPRYSFATEFSTRGTVKE